MKVLLLFDLFRKTSSAESFASAEALRAEDKKTEADLFEVLVRLGHEPDAVGVYDGQYGPCSTGSRRRGPTWC